MIRALLLLALLAGCAAQPSVSGGRVTASAASHAPPFATIPYEPFSRAAIVAIAQREWRLFGAPINDDPPGARPPPLPEDKPERQQGLWQRVGEYWWIGLDPSDRDAYFTGKHDAQGIVFPAGQDATYAWSAAFVSYVMRIAGAGNRFPYSATHSDYINAARNVAAHQTSGWLVSAERPEAYAPIPGDLICTGRARRRALTYDDLPAPTFPSHCDIVVVRDPGQISVIGGNVDDAVTMKHVPTTPDGKIAGPDGAPIDARYDWFVVLRVLDNTPVS
jgi:hypothetical protein